MKKLLALILALVAAITFTPTIASADDPIVITSGPENVDFTDDSYGCVFNYGTLTWTNPSWPYPVVDHYVETRFVYPVTTGWLSTNPPNIGSGTTLLIDFTAIPIGYVVEVRIIAVLDVGSYNVLSQWSDLTDPIAVMNCTD